MILYKYYPCNEFTYQSLALNKFWCGRHYSMNDPFECLGNVDRVYTREDALNFLEAVFPNNPSMHTRLKPLLVDPKIFSEAVNQMRNNMLSDFGFCSFSETNDNILMWSHYANCHKGIVLEFDFPEEYIENLIYKVSYKSSLPSLDHAAAWISVQEESAESNDIILSDLSIKSSHWSYEREWRLWCDQEGYYDYKPEYLKKVYFGVKCPPSTIAIIFRLMDSRFTHVTYLFAQMTSQPIGLNFSDNPEL